MNRYKSLQQFLNPHFKEDEYQLAAITGDASFRRYFRVNTGDQKLYCYGLRSRQTG